MSSIIRGFDESFRDLIRQLGPSTIIVQRMGFAPTTCPTAPNLEALFYPNPATIAEAAYALAKPKAKRWTPDAKKAQLAYQMQFRGPF